MRVLFCSLDARGMINPALGMAHQLSLAGHDVAFASGKSLSGDIEGEGFLYFGLDSDKQSFMTDKWFKPAFNTIQAEHTDLAIQAFNPELIITQPLAIGSIWSARKNKIPHITTGFFSPLWGTSSNNNAREVDKLRAWRVKELLAIYNKFCGFIKSGYLASSHSEQSLLGRYHLVRNTPSIITESLPDYYRLVGDQLWDLPPSAKLMKWVRKMKALRKRLIYVQHGRVFHAKGFTGFLNGWVESGNYAIALSYGRERDESIIDNDCLFSDSYLPQSSVIPHCDGVISNGHTTSILGALKFGKPIYVWPAGGETEENLEICKGISSVFEVKDFMSGEELKVHSGLSFKEMPMSGGNCSSIVDVVGEILKEPISVNI